MNGLHGLLPGSVDPGEKELAAARPTAARPEGRPRPTGLGVSEVRRPSLGQPEGPRSPAALQEGRRASAGTPGGAGLVTPPWPPIASLRLLDEVDSLVQRHREELAECCERWLRATQEATALDRVRRQSTLSGAAGLAWCEPVELHAMPDAAAGQRSASTDSSLSGAQPQTSRVSLSSSRIRPAGLSAAKKDTTAATVASGKKRRTPRRNPMKDLFASKSEVNEATFLQRLTSSRLYEVFSGTLIMVNAVFIGWQTQFVAQRAEADAIKNQPQQLTTPDSFVVLQGIFCFLFTLELSLRWFCDGLVGFFLDADRWWNVLDVMVVLLSVVDLGLHFALEQSAVLGGISVLRVVRVIRVVRVAKVIRIMKFFRELRMMVFSILGSMKSLLWVILILAMTFYLFGITFTAATTSALDTTAKWHRPETENLRNFFGTVDRSVLSLFMAMSGGNDWAVYYDALRNLPPQYSPLFLLFISFAIFAVVNIVTGVFVESAMQSNNKDRDIIVQEELEAKKAYLRSMREIFDEMDEDDTGSISLEEFESKLDDERVIAYFNALKLDVSDARILFWLIDYDQSNEINIDEFLSGCYKLQGESRSLDMKIMQCEVRFLRECFTGFMESLAAVQAGVDALQQGKAPVRSQGRKVTQTQPPSTPRAPC